MEKDAEQEANADACDILIMGNASPEYPERRALNSRFHFAASVSDVPKRGMRARPRCPDSGKQMLFWDTSRTPRQEIDDVPRTWN